jgi:hypothetical protein
MLMRYADSFGNCVVVQQGGKVEPAKVAKPATKATKAAKDVKAKDSKRADVASGLESVNDDKKALIAAMKELLAQIKAQAARTGKVAGADEAASASEAASTDNAATDAGKRRRSFGERRAFNREY